MSELIKLSPAECDALPLGIVQDADLIYDHVISGEPTPITWQGDTNDPFRLDIVARVSPEAKRSTYGHKKIDELPPRLRLESRLQLPLKIGSDHFGMLRSSYLHTLEQDAAVRRLVDARFINNKLTTLRLNQLGEQENSVITHAPYSKEGPFIVYVSNDRNVPNGYAPDRAPYFDRDNIRQLISTYLGLTWLVGAILGDPRVPTAGLLDRYEKGSDSFHRKPGGGRPRPRTAFSSAPTHEERIANNTALNKLRSKYSPPAGIEPLPLNRDHIYNLDLDEIDQISIRVEALREPDRARQWDVSALGGIVIAGEKGSGKSTLALSVADQADVPLFFWPLDVIHAGDSSRTVSKITELRDVIKKHTNGNTLGVVLESMQTYQHASPLEIEEVGRLVRQAVNDPKVLLIGTIATEAIDFATPKHDLTKLGLFGRGLFTNVINMEVTPGIMGNAITRLINDDLVHGKRIFEVLTHEKHDTLLQSVYGYYSISQIEDAIDSCKGRKFLEQRRLNGQHPGPITIHDIIMMLENNDNTKRKGGSPLNQRGFEV